MIVETREERWARKDREAAQRDLERAEDSAHYRREWIERLTPVVGAAQAQALVLWMDAEGYIFASLSPIGWDE